MDGGSHRFFDKCIGRKRNVDGEVLADIRSSDWKSNETSAALRLSSSHVVLVSGMALE